MMQYSEIHTATLAQLNTLASDAGRDTTTDIYLARRAAGQILHDLTGPFDLVDSDTNDVIREATEDDAAESASASAEGHIDVDGRRCYVAE